MDLIDKLRVLATRVQESRDVVQTEEATKTSFILPFIQMLGYDIFDPKEIVPEYTADFGTKQGEKVDYAIMVDGEVAILIECKPAYSDLALNHQSQLYRYFSVSKAKFAILTNGVGYRFYSDLSEQNKLDESPFLEFDITSFPEALVPELKRFTKGGFDRDALYAAASELKFRAEFKRELNAEFLSPSDELLEVFARRIVSGTLTKKIREHLGPIFRKAMAEFMSEQVGSTLRSAIEVNEKVTQEKVAVAEAEVAERSGVETLEEEVQGLMIVKAILAGTIPTSRIAGRDAKSYYSVLLDDNNRKPICRFYFNPSKGKLVVGVFTGADRTQEFFDMKKLEDLYDHREAIRNSAQQY